MKLASKLTVLACTLLIGAAVWGQTADEYQGWMKSNAATVADLTKSLMAKDAAAVSKDTDALQDNMSKTMVYWQIKNKADALKFASDAREGFSNVAILAKQGKFDEAAAAAKMAQANCVGCHMAHRDKAADGTFKIK